MSVRNVLASSVAIGAPRHWFAFLVKICRASQPCSRARRTACETPPATDIWAPMRINGISLAMNATGRLVAVALAEERGNVVDPDRAAVAVLGARVRV